MSEPFLSEIKIAAFDFPPKGWAQCNGQFLPINQNQALFALLGVTYGGNGQTTFALPNLQGRVPIHFGGGHNLGETAGTPAVTVSTQQLPTHVHGMQAKAAQANLAGGNTPSNVESLAQAVAASGTSPPPTVNLYSTDLSRLQAMAPGSVTNTGGSQPHNNMMPYLVLNFIIALQGIFPSRN
jgi:microcystin-dependent protein